MAPLKDGMTDRQRERGRHWVGACGRLPPSLAHSGGASLVKLTARHMYGSPVKILLLITAVGVAARWLAVESNPFAPTQYTMRVSGLTDRQELEMLQLYPRSGF